MKSLSLCCCAAILSFAAAASALAADPWTGTWKEDTSRNKSNTTVSYTAKGAGFHFSNGSTIQYDFVCDGKTYPTYSNQSMKCTMVPDGSIDWTTMVDGKVVQEMHRTFSADGKTMTMDETLHLNDGTTTKEVITRARVSGTTGLAGEWVNKKLADADPEVLTLSVKGDVYHLQTVHSTVYYDFKLDGTDAKAMGKDAPPGATQSYKSASPTKLLVTSKLNGKVMDEGTMSLSPDGKTMTLATWLPGKENLKTEFFYIKQ